MMKTRSIDSYIQKEHRGLNSSNSAFKFKGMFEVYDTRGTLAIWDHIRVNY